MFTIRFHAPGGDSFRALMDAVPALGHIVHIVPRGSTAPARRCQVTAVEWTALPDRERDYLANVKLAESPETGLPDSPEAGLLMKLQRAGHIPDREEEIGPLTDDEMRVLTRLWKIH